MKVRSLLSSLALLALGVSQAACSSLSRPDEITIRAEVAAPVPPPAPAPAPLPMPAAGQAAPAAGG